MRLTAGMKAPRFEATSLGGNSIGLDALRGRMVLLKFYRFATCPVCNLHLRGFIRDYAALDAAGITTVVFFHSPQAKLAGIRTDEAPFPLIPDPQKNLFRLYGVERGWRGMISPAVARDYMRALRAGFSPGLFTSDGGVLGNPADFLVDADGRIVLAHYGRQYADSLTVRDVLEQLRRTTTPCVVAAAAPVPRFS